MAIMEAIRTPRLQIARLRHDILVTGERYPGREEVVGHIVCQYSQMLLHLRIADVLFQTAGYFVGTDIDGYLCNRWSSLMMTDRESALPKESLK